MKIERGNKNVSNVGILPQHIRRQNREDLDLKYHRRESLRALLHITLLYFTSTLPVGYKPSTLLLPKVEDHWEDLGVGGRITLGWILGRERSMGRTGFGWLRIVSNGGLL
jgi:hypothetical protein